MVLGLFEDDYGGRHEVTRAEWRQGARSRYRIVAWVPDSGFLVAQNMADHPSAPGKWSRIDWVALPGMPPWEWAFCFTAYDAPTEAAARAATADRTAPRTGCNKYPFSRMKRVP